MRSCCASDTGLGWEKQIKSWPPPKRNSSCDRFFRTLLSAKSADMEKGPNSDWDRLASSGEGVLRRKMPDYNEERGRKKVE